MELAEGSVVYYPIERCPANFITLVGSRVEVLTVNQMTYSGNIYSMDPITGSLFLMDCQNEDRSIKLVVGNSIQCLRIVNRTRLNTSELLQHGTNQGMHPTDDLKPLKDSLENWFRESHIPVAIHNANLVILNEVTLEPPYKIENSSSTNEVMLWRVRKLLENFYEKR